MKLTNENLKNISPQPGLTIPDENVFGLPEKVLQFGTGVLLRGLPDYFIDKANRHGIFNGRVVMVKSTSIGSHDAFHKQDNLYTLCVKGIEENKKIEEYIINSSVNRVISANENWDAVLECAHNPEMKIIISNTTEVGITLVEDDIRLYPPHSFPGKLLAFLYERYKAFNGRDESGMVIIPTELITDNGKKLRSIVLELASMNKLDETFIKWIEISNHFCNSLVDRIVPGKLPAKDKEDAENKLGYSDELMIMAESFRLWAIETDNDKVKQLLSFSKADDGVVISPDIEKFKELKLRLLNGTHTFCCGLAFLSGFNTVKEAMEDENMSSFIRNLMTNEIAEATTSEFISQSETTDFAAKVMDRFRNPSLDHQWMNITVQYSSKMKMRNIPLLLKHYSNNDHIPEHMAFGFAAFLLFMKCKQDENGQYAGSLNGTEYIVQDDHAAWFSEKWKSGNTAYAVDAMMSDKEFWGADLSSLNGFAEQVKSNIFSIVNKGARAAMRSFELHKAEA